MARPELPEDLAAEVIEQVDISLKYDSYIQRQETSGKSSSRRWRIIRKIPEDMDYDAVSQPSY